MSRHRSAAGAPLDAASSGSNDQQGKLVDTVGPRDPHRRVRVRVGVGLALVFAILFLAITGLRHRSLEARHSQQVIATANQLQTLVIDLETGVRGFAITRDESVPRSVAGAQTRSTRAR